MRSSLVAAESLEFLHELSLNNDRDWWAENKDRYEAVVREPALDFITAMGPEIARISEHYTAIPSKVGGSMMRPYRDTRFSKDKTPFKTNIGIQFRHERAKDVHAPGFYLHIDNTGCFLAAGAWRPEGARPLMGSVRSRLRTAITPTWSIRAVRLRGPVRGAFCRSATCVTIMAVLSSGQWA